MKKVVKQTLLSITVITVIVIAIWYMLNIFEYSLRATTKSDGSVIIQSLSLGEYYTPVTLFEVYESTTSLKVVALERKSEDSRVHTITLRQGLNHFDDMYLDGYKINYSGNVPYLFKSQTEYTAKVKYGVYVKEVSFVLP